MDMGHRLLQLELRISRGWAVSRSGSLREAKGEGGEKCWSAEDLSNSKVSKMESLVEVSVQEVSLLGIWTVDRGSGVLQEGQYQGLLFWERLSYSSLPMLQQEAWVQRSHLSHWIPRWLFFYWLRAHGAREIRWACVYLDVTGQEQ